MKYGLVVPLITLGMFSLQGCNSKPMTPAEQARSDRAAYALMSLSGSPSTADFGRQMMGGGPYVPTNSNNQTKSGLLNPLKHTYRLKGDTFCVYQDTSVVNIGVGICPLNN